jgi:hypothetical protein
MTANRSAGIWREFNPKKVLEVDTYSRPTDIRLRRGKLFWDSSKRVEVRPTVQTFRGFLNLFNTSDKEIKAFAERWGVLDFSAGKSGESCDEWRRTARIAGAVLQISQ